MSNQEYINQIKNQATQQDKCTQCGKCCRLVIMRLGEVSDDWIKWIGYHNRLCVEVIDGIKYLRIDEPCDKLINGKCSINEDKPELCKAFYCEEQKQFKHLL